MAKGLIGGITDYSHQSFDDIVNDLENELRNVISFSRQIEDNIDKVTKNGYWNNNVPFDFKNIVAYSLRHYNTTKTEFQDILQDIKSEVKEHHCKRLQQIARVASEINRGIGTIWHQEYDSKDYGNPDFRIVEDIYAKTRDMAVNLLDISNLATRLTDYIGKTNKSMTKNNPWISGSFYLFVAVVAITGLAVLSNVVHWTVFPIIIFGGILLISVIGAFQLKNDDKLKDESFLKLITETYKRLPLIRRKDK